MPTFSFATGTQQLPLLSTYNTIMHINIDNLIATLLAKGSDEAKWIALHLKSATITRTTWDETVDMSWIDIDPTTDTIGDGISQIILEDTPESIPYVIASFDNGHLNGLELFFPKEEGWLSTDCPDTYEWLAEPLTHGVTRTQAFEAASDDEQLEMLALMFGVQQSDITINPDGSYTIGCSE